jgi:hypothetical protein
MKKQIYAWTLLALAFGLQYTPTAVAQVVIEDRAYQTPGYGEQQTESEFLRDWNRRHDARARGTPWQSPETRFGPSDAMRLVQARGYRVYDVQDVGERFLVRATRGDDKLLVSVSRRGDIMGIVHQDR